MIKHTCFCNFFKLLRLTACYKSGWYFSPTVKSLIKIINFLLIFLLLSGCAKQFHRLPSTILCQPTPDYDFVPLSVPTPDVDSRVKDGNIQPETKIITEIKPVTRKKEHKNIKKLSDNVLSPVIVSSASLPTTNNENNQIKNIISAFFTIIITVIGYVILKKLRRSNTFRSVRRYKGEI